MRRATSTKPLNVQKPHHNACDTTSSSPLRDGSNDATMNSRPTIATALKKHHNRLLVLLGGLSFLLYYFLRQQSPSPGAVSINATLNHFFATLALLFALLLGAVTVVRASLPQKNTLRLSLFIIFAGALLFRMMLVGQSPWLSNDIFRYLWDGRLLDHGINPYTFPPVADELAQVRDDEIYPNVDHKSVHSVYPPVLQILFWLGFKISEVFALAPFAGLKLLFVLVDLGLVLVLFRLLAQMKIDPRWAILYAWHPLAIIEIAGSGHTDGLGASTLILMSAFFLRQRFLLTAVFLALGFLIKFLAAMFLPFVIVAAWQEGGFKKAASTIAVFTLVVLACYAPFAGAGENLYAGLLVYSEKWRFNDGLFSLIFTPVHWLLPDGLVKFLMIPAHWEISPQVYVTRRIDLALIITKLIVAALFLLIYLRLFLRWIKSGFLPQAKGDWFAILMIILAAFFLLSPTLHPWYLLWLLPVLCFKEAIPANASPSSINLPLWILSATVFLSYTVLANYLPAGFWREPQWVRWVEYGIPCGVWLWAMRRSGNGKWIFKNSGSGKEL